MKKIVICPTFAETHLVKCHIPNMIDVIEPDYIIYVDGVFPSGAENKINDEQFQEKWCNKTIENNPSFDYVELCSIADQYHDKVKCDVLKFGSDANENFVKAVSHFMDIDVEIGDLIFPLEPDAFLWEGDKEIINQIIDKLKPGQGISCKWVDFLETQYYIENINITWPKFRRFCYCFDNIENYMKAIDGYMSQNYPILEKCEDFFIRHYAWFRPGIYKQHRYEMVKRPTQYWKDFENGLQEIKRQSLIINSKKAFQINESSLKGKILIRPSRQDEARWASFIDIPHPKHIQSHPNFIK